MRWLIWISRMERILCALGFVVMAGALILDVGMRLTLGHGMVGAAQLGLVGMLITALFGVGLAADAGQHFRPRVLDNYRPPAWEPAMARTGYLLTAGFFSIVAWLSATVAAESYRLADVTSLLRWPVWLLQGVFVLAFGCNAVRYMLYALRPDLSPTRRRAPEHQPIRGAGT